MDTGAGTPSHGSRDSQSHERPAIGLASSTIGLNPLVGLAGADDRWSLTRDTQTTNYIQQANSP